MPKSTLVASRVLAHLGAEASKDRVEAALFASKAELAQWEGDELTIEATPDRLDLLDEGGLAFHLQGALDLASGLPTIPRHAADPKAFFRVDPSVDPIRPAIAGALLVAPPDEPLDLGLLNEAVRFQELVHATIGRDRRAASIGLYPVERFDFPVSYSLEPVDSLRFIPLDATESTDGPRFFAEHPMAAAYGSLGTSGSRCLVLKDAEGEVLSLPPILNSRGAGEARPGDRELLVESTGTRAARVADSVGLMILPFVARGWSVAPVRLEGPGDRREDGLGPISPRSLHLGSVALGRLYGAALPPNQVERWVRRARLGAHPETHGYRVDVPPWRPDILAEVDVIEDVLIARGLSADDGILPPSSTRGRRRAESIFRAKVAELWIGLGYTELYTSVLVPAASVGRLQRRAALALENPVSDLYSHLRDRLLISLIDVLGRNTRHGYPQRFFELGPVLVADERAEGGAFTRHHSGALLASESAGFADAAALADHMVGAFGALGVREPCEIPGTTPGRSARLKVAGEVVAEVGEIDPEVLTALHVPVPVAWAELDLSALWPLVRRGENP